MSTVKVVVVFSIIFGCFAMLYPRFLHPIVLKSFGMAPKPVENDILANMPPPRAAANVDRGRPGEDVRQMRPGPHPGLRAASEMRAQQQQQTGSGRGMMGIVLPMYAVGIVLYLVYTLVKVFSKRSEPEPREKDPLAQLRNFKYDDRKGKFTFGEDFDPDDDFRDYIKKKHKQQELEELINKADDRHITELEMRQLQQRLEETESQMTRILQAMQSVQQHVSGVVDRASGNSTHAAKNEQNSNKKSKEHPTMFQENFPENCENQNANTENQSNVISSDSNPDLESYEVLATNGNGSEASSDYSFLNENGGSRNSPEVESVSSLTNPDSKKSLENENQFDIKNSQLSDNSNNKFEEDYDDGDDDDDDDDLNSPGCDDDDTAATTTTATTTREAKNLIEVEEIGPEEQCTEDNVLLRKRTLPVSSKD